MALASTVDTKALVDFDFPRWQQAIQQQADALDVADYLQDPGPYDATKDPWYTTEKPQIPPIQTAARQSNFQQEFAHYQAYEAQYRIKRQAAVSLLRFIIDTLPEDLRPWTLDARSPAKAYHAVATQIQASSSYIRSHLETEYYRLRNTRMTYTPLNWCDALVKIYRRALPFNATFLPHATLWFINDVEQWNPRFTTLHSEHEEEDFLAMVEKFKIAYNKRLRSMETEQALTLVAHNDASKAMKPSNPPAPPGSNPTANTSNKKPMQPCLCGYKHPWKDCWSLNPALRPPGWKPRPRARTAIHEAMQDSKRRAVVERIIGHEIPQDILHTNYVPPNPPSSHLSTSTTSPPAISPAQTPRPADDEMSSYVGNITIASTYVATSDVVAPPYKNWWILDTGSGIHIAHDIRSFSTYRPFDDNDKFDVTFGTSGRATAIGIGSVPLMLNHPNGTVHSVNIGNIYHIPGFLTNIISPHILETAYGLYYDALDRTLRDSTGKSHISVFTQYRQVIFAKSVDSSRCQNHTAILASSYVKPSPKPATIDVWHARLGHPSDAVMSRLMTHTDARIDGKPSKRLGPCQVCLEARAKQQISRNPMARGTAPFQIVHFDFIFMPTALNHMRYMLHFYDTYSGTNRVYAMATRLSTYVVPVIKGFVTWCRNNGFILRRLHTDCDTSLTDLGIWLQTQGVDFTQSTPYNPQQNGFSEVSGYTIIATLRAIHSHSGLPEILWPWTALAAAYILARRPTQRLGWNTPMSQIDGVDPSLAALRIIGCKAYVLRKKIPRGDKLTSRVWIGYLVGIQATNIWHIWDPSKKRIRLVRDVVFDENCLYKDSIKDIEQLAVAQDDIELAVAPYRAEPATPLAIEPEYPQINLPLDDSQQSSQDKETTQQLPTPRSTPEASLHIDAPHDDDDVEAQDDIEILDSEPLLDAFQQAYGRHDDVKIARRDRIYAPHIHISLLATSMPTRRHISSVPPPPKSWTALAKHPLATEFRSAMDAEIDVIRLRHTWDEVSISTVLPNQEILPLKWVYTYKTDNDGFIMQYKARLVVRGDLQASHISRNELYAHTATMRTFRMLVAIAAAHHLAIHQMDAITAFLHATLDDDEVFHVKQPPGIPLGDDIVLRLRRPLYGLRIAPKAWFRECTRKLRILGAKQVPEEPCLWLYEKTYVFFYVDDFLVIGSPTHVDAVKMQLTRHFEMRDLGPATHFLGIQIDRIDDAITLSQDKYIDKLLTEFKILEPRKTPTTPIQVSDDSLKSTDGTATRDERRLLQRLVGSLLYLALNTRPEISRAVHILAEHASNPTPHHITAAKQIVQYVAYHRQYRIRYLPNTEILYAATDAAYADNADRHSTQGHVIFLHGGPITWSCKKQPTVALSTTEAELTALTHGVRDLIAISRLLSQIHAHPAGPIDVLCDNQQTVGIANNTQPYITTKLRHIDVQQHWLRELIQKQATYIPENPRLSISWIETSKMPADGLTKLLSHEKQRNFAMLLRLLPISPANMA